jgi:hypothetical protein
VGNCVSFVLLIVIGKLTDKISVRCLLPFALLFRSLMFFLASRIDNPDSTKFYCTMAFVYVSYYFVIVVHLSYLAKIYPKDIRGMCNAMAGFMSFVGIFAYVAYSSWLSETSTDWPLKGVSIVDLTGAVLVILLSFLGFF